MTLPQFLDQPRYSSVIRLLVTRSCGQLIYLLYMVGSKPKFSKANGKRKHRPVTEHFISTTVIVRAVTNVHVHAVGKPFD